MRKLKLIASLFFACVLAMTMFTSAMTVKAEETINTVYFGDGFFCLQYEKDRPLPIDPAEMRARPSTEYTVYEQSVLDEIAAYIMLQSDYYLATGGENGGVIINNDDLQGMIWYLTGGKTSERFLEFTRDETEQAGLKDKRKKYLNYVYEHMSEVPGNYTMTIWDSVDNRFQDILELKLVEKHGVPSLEKKVMDRNDSDNSYDSNAGWQDSADYDIGDIIPFQLTATLRGMPDFTSYYLEFTDHMEHLQMQDGLVVTIDGNDVTSAFTFEKTVSADGETTDFRVYCENILPLGAEEGSKVVVNYSAKLTDKAVICDPLDDETGWHNTGNYNTARLIYTRNSGTADKGITPPDTVRVFTYAMVANKVDPDGQPLTGAAFKLSKRLEDGTYKTVGLINAVEIGENKYEIIDGSVTTFEWSGIDDGTYLLEEVVTPTGYNTMPSRTFTLTAVHDRHGDDPRLHLFRTDYEGFDGFWDNDGVYEMLWPTEAIETSIVNKPGTLLPETGGIGTKAFYMIGAAMMAVSGVLLTVKKRMQA